MGGILAAAGVPGFLDSLQAYRASTQGGDERNAEKEVVQALVEQFGLRDFTPGEIAHETAIRAQFAEPAGLRPTYSSEDDGSNMTRIGKYMSAKIVGRTWQAMIGGKEVAVEVRSVVERPRRWCIAVLNRN